MKIQKFMRSGLVLAMLIATPALIISATDKAQAQQYRYMSCGELWFERNAIYADKGYCFKTRRARREFGRACFPPYGRLGRSEQNRVATIRRWERRKGCR